MDTVKKKIEKIESLIGKTIVTGRIIESRESEPDELKNVPIPGTYEYLYLKFDDGCEFVLGGGMTYENEPRITDMKGSIDSLYGLKIIDAIIMWTDSLNKIDRMFSDEYREYYDDSWNKNTYLKIVVENGNVFECLFYESDFLKYESTESYYRLFKDKKLLETSSNYNKEVEYD